jgi:hemerythrin
MPAASFTWLEHYNVHVEDMDVQHQRLAGFISDLRTALDAHAQPRTVGTILDRLVQYVYIHFSDEEQFMERHGYPDLERHAELHRQFYGKLVELQQRVTEGNRQLGESDTETIFSWLAEHLTQVDRKYGEYFAH